MSTSVASIAFTFGQGANTLSLAQFQSNQALVDISVPDVIINSLGQLLTYIVSHANNSDISEPLCTILDHGFQLIWNTSNTDAMFRGKMAIMVPDFTLNLGAHIFTMSDEFSRCGITLVVVGNLTPVQEIWNDYRTLAQNTGGEFMLSDDAHNILGRAVFSILYEGKTLHQAFDRVRQPNDDVVPNHIAVMNEQDQETDDVGDLAFDHGLSE